MSERAVRGLVLTTEIVLTKVVKISIAAFLSYRLYALFQMEDTSNFSEFTAIFEDNSKKGITSLVYFLSKFDQKWLYLLLSSPAIAGLLKGLWDTRKSEPLTESAITQLQEAVEHHTNVLLRKSCLWHDVLRQMIPIPGFSSISESVQKAEQQIRWDGRISHKERAALFSNIELLALHGSGMSKLNAMQSLAKIVHSLSIKDFPRLQYLGYSKETLVQILRIKIQAFRDLKTLSTRARLEPMSERKVQSLLSGMYAAYLLWWLGMGEFKYSSLFLTFKLGNLALEGLFLKVMVESILEAIKCPDKKYFSLRSGDFEIRANDLISECFKEFVRQFRLFFKEESFESFLAELNNFDFTDVKAIDLSDKALTSYETLKILNVLKSKNALIKMLNLGNNRIHNTSELLFPNTLQSLDLSDNEIDDTGALGLNLPNILQSLDLQFNAIGDVGAQGLRLPDNLQELNLGNNNIGDAGTEALKLPDNLQSLYLSSNKISDTGAQGLRLPNNTKFLFLELNKIGPVGAQGLKLPDNLQFLYLNSNNIGDAGAQGLRLPNNLKFLGLSYNNISAVGVQGLGLPDNLQELDLSANNIGDAGIQKLKLPNNIQYLYLDDNNIGDAGAQGLRLPDNLQSLGLGLHNNIGDAGAKGLRLPSKLQFLELSWNKIGDAGARGLKLPDNLQSLSLLYNNISDAGVNALLQKIPRTNLITIDLNGNPYNATAINVNRSIQQQTLIRNCQDKLCYANTSLSHDAYQTSCAIRAQPPLFFYWLKKPVDTLTDYISDCISTTLNNVGTRLERVLRQSSSYFPNIHSLETNDWQPSPSESVMLHQFRNNEQNTLFLSASQTVTQPFLRTIGR